MLKMLAPDIPRSGSWCGSQAKYCVQAVYEPYAGFLESEKCIAAHIKGAIAAGADVRLNSPIASWASGRGPNDPVTVTTEGGDTFFAKSLVLSAGSWMPKLVPQLKNFCTVERQVVVWFEVRKLKLSFPHLAGFGKPVLAGSGKPELLPPGGMCLLHNSNICCDVL